MTTRHTPAQRRRLVNEAIDNYKALAALNTRAAALTLEILSHPEATDEQVAAAARGLRDRLVRQREVYQSLLKAARTEGADFPRIAYLERSPPEAVYSNATRRQRM